MSLFHAHIATTRQSQDDSCLGLSGFPTHAVCTVSMPSECGLWTCWAGIPRRFVMQILGPQSRPTNWESWLISICIKSWRPWHETWWHYLATVVVSEKYPHLVMPSPSGRLWRLKTPKNSALEGSSVEKGKLWVYLPTTSIKKSNLRGSEYQVFRSLSLGGLISTKSSWFSHIFSSLLGFHRILLVFFGTQPPAWSLGFSQWTKTFPKAPLLLKVSTQVGRGSFWKQTAFSEKKAPEKTVPGQVL